MGESEDALRKRIAVALPVTSVEGATAIIFHPSKGGGRPVRLFSRGGGANRFVDVQTGMVKVYVRPEDPWAGLIPANCVAPGFYQRAVAAGGGDFVWQKVKG